MVKEDITNVDTKIINELTLPFSDGGGVSVEGAEGLGHSWVRVAVLTGGSIWIQRPTSPTHLTKLRIEIQINFFMN